MTESFLKKYIPKKIDDFLLKPDIVVFLNYLIQTNALNIMINGSMGVGKTTLLKLLVNIYYNGISSEYKKENIMIINCLKEQGIQYYRNDVKNFCQTRTTIQKKKKLLIIDDLDGINDQSQQIFRNYIDKYSNNVMFITTSTNINKINENILSRIFIIKLNNVTTKKLDELYETVVNNEHLNIDKKIKETLLKISNASYKNLLNILEKIKLTEVEVNNDNLYKICSNINYNKYDKYTSYIISGNLHDSIKTIIDIYNDGYSVVDILYFYYNYIKVSTHITEENKFIIINMLCKYIAIINNAYEDEIELALFTNKLLEKIQKCEHTKM